jgi:hypothetical protein
MGDRVSTTSNVHLEDSIFEAGVRDQAAEFASETSIAVSRSLEIDPWLLD